MLIGDTNVGELPGIGSSFSVCDIALSMDQWTVFIGSEPIGEDPTEIRYWTPRDMGMGLVKSVDTAWDMYYALTNINNDAALLMTVGLKDSLRFLSMGISIAPNFESTVPSASVLNALVWSWAETFDAVWRKMDTMSTALKIDYADGTYLDDAWGQIYDLPRIYQEDDTNYRHRLKTRTLTLTSSGTVANCEAIIDSIIGEESTEVNSQYPASVNIRFNTISAMKEARSKQTLLEYLIPKMLASGVSYKMYLPYIELLMDVYINGPLTLSFNILTAINLHDIDAYADFNIINTVQAIIAFDNDILLQDNSDISFNISPYIVNNTIKAMLADLIIRKYDEEHSYLFDMITKNFGVTDIVEMRMALQKFDDQKSYAITTTNKASFKKNYNTVIELVNQPILQYTSDIILRLYLRTLYIDITTARNFPKRFGMLITLAGA